MRIFISGGGTAGHIYPAVAIVAEFKKHVPDFEVYFVGREDLLEKKIAAKENYPFLAIDSMPLYKKPINKAIKSARAFFRGVSLSKKHIKKYKPDAVITTGGYVSGPIGYAAKLTNTPLYIHESNAQPGITTKFLDKYSRITFLPYEGLEDKFKRQGNKRVSGTPIRAKFNEMSSVDKKKKLVLSFGGSGGQKKLNEAVAEIFNSQKKLDFDWIHISGLDWEKEFKQAVSNIPDYATVYTYYDEFYKLMSRADLVVCGCGAQTLNEVSAMKKASILIPKMYVVGNHQYINALQYKNNGAGDIIKEDELTGELLLSKIVDIVYDRDRLEKMGQNANKFYVKNSAEIIVKTILEDLGNNEKTI